LFARTEIANASQPQLSVAADGRVWLTYAQGGDVFATSSKDAGETFDEPMRLPHVAGTMVGMRRGPRIAANGDQITVTVIAHELIAFHSPDAGKTWTGPITINDVPTSAREGLHDLAIAPTGELFVTWLDLRSAQMELWAAKSTDSGRTWTKDQRLYRSPDGAICTCCQPSALFDAAGNLAVMWRNSIGGERDMWLMTQKRGADSFSTARKLGKASWKIDGCPMDGGEILAHGQGTFSTVWQRAGEIFFCPMAGAEVSCGAGKQPVAVTQNGETLVAWQRGTELVSARMNETASPTWRAADGRFPVLVALDKDRGAILAYEQGPKAAPSVVIERF
jgi:hypothetical protein